MNAALYRIRQGLWRLWGIFKPVDEQAAAAVLTPELLALFRRMPKGDRLHSLRVMERLRAQGHDQPDLLVAALLHDSGKSRCRFTLFDRTLAVLAKVFLPGLYARHADAEPRGLWRAIPIAEQHPRWSAEDMAAAGAGPLAVTLARRHQERPPGEPVTEEDRLLVLLQAVDDLS